jgi:ribose transport system permease protein
MFIRVRVKGINLSKISKFIIGKNIIYLAFFLLILFFSVALGGMFFSLQNLMNILRQTAMISIMAIGMTFALGSGEIDLSVGSVIALSALVTAMTLKNFNLAMGILAGIGVGLGVGLFNGLIVAQLRVPSFLVTIASMGIIGGLSRWITGLKSIEITNEHFNYIFGSGNIGKAPILFVWTIVVLIIGYLTINRTAYGRKLLATGGNEKAAYFTGIKTRWIKMSALIFSATTAALAGMLYAGRLHGARYSIGEGYELSVIAATVLGGTSLFGGKATALGSVVGALVIGIINNGLILMGLDVSQQMFFRGIILLIAISINIRAQFR